MDTSSTAFASTSVAVPLTAADDAEDQPFTLVSSKRRPRRVGHRKPTYSNSNGTLAGASSSGFSYASSSSSDRRRRGKSTGDSDAKQADEEARILAKAVETVDMFVGYLGCELGMGRVGEGRMTYAQELAATLESVWPGTGSSGNYTTLALDATSTASTATVETPDPTKSSKDNPTESGKDEKKEKHKTAIVPTQIICLGLGSLTTCRSAQVQLALMVVLRSYLCLLQGEKPATRLSETAVCSSMTDPPSTAEQSPQSKAPQPITCLAYDPIFTPLDHSLLHHYSITSTTSSTITTCYTPITTPTLLYMPHCDRSLYESLLSLNIDSPMVLLCNVLSNYALNPRLEREAPTLHSVVERFVVSKLPNWTAKQTLVREGMGEEVKQQTARFGRCWDRNALRDLGFHWLSRHE